MQHRIQFRKLQLQQQQQQQRHFIQHQTDWILYICSRFYVLVSVEFLLSDPIYVHAVCGGGRDCDIRRIEKAIYKASIIWCAEVSMAILQDIYMALEHKIHRMEKMSVRYSLCSICSVKQASKQWNQNHSTTWPWQK